MESHGEHVLNESEHLEYDNAEAGDAVRLVRDGPHE